jgi:hypothetical protein
MIDTSSAETTYKVRDILNLIKSTVKQKPELSAELAATIADTQQEINETAIKHLREYQTLLYLAVKAAATQDTKELSFALERSKGLLAATKYNFEPLLFQLSEELADDE